MIYTGMFDKAAGALSEGKPDEAIIASLKPGNLPVLTLFTGLIRFLSIV